MTGNTDMHLLVTDTLKKSRGVDQKNIIWCDHHLHRIELIRMLIVACVMLSHSSSIAVQSCWIMHSTMSQTCQMGDMSGEYAGHGKTGTFSPTKNCVQILATWGRALSCWKMRWWRRMNGTTMGLRISSRYFCAMKLPSIINAIVFVVHSLCLPIPKPHCHHWALCSQHWH